MSGQARRTVAWVIAVVVVVVVTGFVAPVLLVPPADAPLASVLLDNRDVGAIEPGFRRELSRATEEPVPLPEWIPSSVRRVAQVPTHRNEWAAPDRGRTIVVVGHRLQLPVLASAVFDGLVRTATAHAAREVTIAAVPGARGFIEAPNGPGDPARRYVAILQQGTLVLTVVVSASDIADDRDLHLAERLMQKQSAKVPETRSAPVMTSDSELAVWSAAGTLLALLTYLSLASLIAWRSDPLRRGRRAPASLAAPRPAGTPANPAVDVTSAANRQRRAAQVWTTIELAGFAVAAPGAFPFTWPTGLVVVAVGTAMAGLAAILRSDRRNHPFQPERLPRRRRIRMIFYSAVSALCVFCGLVGLLLYGIGGFVASQLLIRNVAIAGIGIVFVAAGTLLFRHTRRLAVSTAREALRADLRPAVLYLRAFADDALRLRSARYARPLLLERLSPRGFDRFEEAIVRSLSAVGPVVAINPPGTRLAPLGAARETLDSDEWQPQVAQRIRDAALIVVGAAPQAPTPGLMWELSAIDNQRRWPTTLLVLPPLPADELRRRWTQFVPLLNNMSMTGHSLPAEPGQVLVATASTTSGWTVMTATRRNEWTYRAALIAAADRGC